MTWLAVHLFTWGQDNDGHEDLLDERVGEGEKEGHIRPCLSIRGFAGWGSEAQIDQ